MSEGVNFHWVLRSSPFQFLKYEITSTVENPEIARVEYTGISSMDVFNEDSGKFLSHCEPDIHPLSRPTSPQILPSRSRACRPRRPL